MSKPFLRVASGPDRVRHESVTSTGTIRTKVIGFPPQGKDLFLFQPSSEYYWLSLGDQYYRRDLPAFAIKSYQEALRVNPGCLPACWRILRAVGGITLSGMGRFRAARKLTARIKGSKPTDRAGWVMKFLTEIHEESYQQARRTLVEIARFPWGPEELSWGYQLLGDFQRAKRWLNAQGKIAAWDQPSKFLAHQSTRRLRLLRRLSRSIWRKEYLEDFLGRPGKPILIIGINPHGIRGPRKPYRDWLARARTYFLRFSRRSKNSPYYSNLTRTFQIDRQQLHEYFLHTDIYLTPTGGETELKKLLRGSRGPAIKKEPMRFLLPLMGLFEPRLLVVIGQMSRDWLEEHGTFRRGCWYPHKAVRVLPKEKGFVKLKSSYPVLWVPHVSGRNRKPLAGQDQRRFVKTLHRWMERFDS